MNRTLTTLACFMAILGSTLFAQIADFGAQTKPVAPAVAEHQGLPANTGFEVTEVFLGSTAASLELERGDIITHLNKRPVKNLTSLSRLIGSMADVGTKVQIDWLRGKRKMSGTATLAASATTEEFAQRYPEAGASAPAAGVELQGLPEDLAKMLGNLGGAAGISGMMIGPDGKAVQFGQGNGLDLKALGLDAKMIEDQVGQALKAQGLDGLLGGLDLSVMGTSGVSVVTQVQTLIPSENGTINYSKKGENKHRFVIKDTDAEVVYKGTISADQIEEIPELFRDDAKRLMSGDIMKPLGGQADSSAPPIAAEDLQELLKGLQNSQDGE